MKHITSLQNPLVKEIVTLSEKSRYRKKTQRFLVEGEREIRLALDGNYTFETIFFQPEIISSDSVKQLFQNIPSLKLIEVSLDVYQKISYRTSTEGILAIVHSKPHSLDTLVFANKNPLILVMEAPEKPGNIGALLRTADAAGLDAVLIANPKTDLYNPNTIRSSVGCIFTTQIAMGTTHEIISFLKEKNFQIYCAALSASVPYTEVSYRRSTAIVVGTEDVGLSEQWLIHASQNIIIPMRGRIDSMNVSVAAAIIVFEAVRSRKEI